MKTFVAIKCGHCGKRSKRRACDVARARKARLNIYCNRRCAGLGRRSGKAKSQRVKEKAAYDADYRKKNRAMLKAKKAEYFQRTYDSVAAAVERKKRMPRHVEYCRQPKYRAWKQKYDRKHRAEKFFGPFAEIAMLTQDLNLEIKRRMTNAEIKWENKTANKTQFRKRACQEESRGRPRAGSDGHRAAHG